MKIIIVKTNSCLFYDDLDKSVKITIQNYLANILNHNINYFQLNNIRNQIEIALIKRN
jgi:hypothetical protein